MQEAQLYRLVRCPGSEAGRVILLRPEDTGSDAQQKAEELLEKASVPSKERYQLAERLMNLLKELAEPVALRVQCEHPQLSQAGVEILKEVLLQKNVRLAVAIDMAVIVMACLAGMGADRPQPGRKEERLARGILLLNHETVGLHMSRALGMNWEPLGELAGEDLISVEELTTSTEFLNVMSNAPYHAVREALALNRFQTSQDSPWPTASLERGNSRGHAQLFPIEAELQPYLDPGSQRELIDRMWKQRSELSDLDADVLDMMSAIWLEQARNADSTARARIDDLLRLRGLKPKTGEGGRSSGFRIEQREQLFRTLHHLNNLWVRMSEIEMVPADGERRGRKTKIQNVSSRAFIITDIAGNQRGSDAPLEIEEFLFRPGMVFANFLFGVGRQTALLSRKAVEYDPYRQSWEKRLARYLSWQWRVEASHTAEQRSFRAETLLEAVGEHWDSSKSRRLKERLEKALNQLASNSVIESWSWNMPERVSTSRRYQNENWHQNSIRIQQPTLLRQHYNSLLPQQEVLEKQLALPMPATPPRPALAEALLWRRKELKLAQGVIAKQFGITQAYYSQVESGKRQPSEELARRLAEWLEEPI